jgi:hypothetical protein
MYMNWGAGLIKSFWEAVLIAVVLALVMLGRESFAGSLDSVSSEERLRYIRSAQVWQPTDISHMDIWQGPEDTQYLGFEQNLDCDYVPKKPHGTTSKFHCKTKEGTKIKVRYDAANGKLYSMPASTRLFWALGFGAVRSYPARVYCHGCPEDPWLDPQSPDVGDRYFHPAVVDLKMPGETIAEVDQEDSGWSWDELDEVDEESGGAPRKHRDALKLLAAFVQHGDNNAGQQRLICLPEGVQKDARGNTVCTQPFMVVEDLGSTFGGSEMLDERASMNLAAWQRHPIWKDREDCIADLAQTPSGTLSDPQISEEGRAFLANLLTQLTDHQIALLFRVGRANHRDQNEHSRFPKYVPISEWVRVFKAKREEIVNTRCRN